ncbi:MAG: type IV pilus modification PilV family protein [Chloroflexota bacterium]
MHSWDLKRFAVSDAGFTLIETFIAIVLLTVGLLGTAALTTGVVRGNLASKNMTSATAIAQSCFEENRRVGYASAGAVPTGGSNSCVAGNATVTASGVSFTRNLAVDTSVANVKTLTVTVTWSEGAVGTKSIVLKTIMAVT